MLSAKRNLGKYWKFGETVARHMTSAKQSGSTDALNMIPTTDLRFLEGIVADFQAKAAELGQLAENIKQLLGRLQSQPKCSVQALKTTVKAHSDALVGLAERLGSFQDDIEKLRGAYRSFTLLHRHDSRDPFAPKYSPSAEPAQPAAAPPPAAPQAAPFSSAFGTKPAAPALGFALPTANSFLNK